MKMPSNTFKKRLANGQSMTGLWCSLPGTYAAEVVAGSGYDWLMFDTEHSPGDPLTVLGQLQAVAPYDLSAVVRPAANDPVLIKRFLDLGAQTLLIPYVQSAEEARAAVRAMLYPPEGIRGASALTRATRFGRVKAYGTTAAEDLCLIVQVETLEALDRLEDIAREPGVDAIFFGPADLSASMGLIGQHDHPDVLARIKAGYETCKRLNKPFGLLTSNQDFARESRSLGAAFVAIGVDAGILARGADTLAASFKEA